MHFFWQYQQQDDEIQQKKEDHQKLLEEREEMRKKLEAEFVAPTPVSKTWQFFFVWIFESLIIIIYYALKIVEGEPRTSSGSIGAPKILSWGDENSNEEIPVVIRSTVEYLDQPDIITMEGVKPMGECMELRKVSSCQYNLQK